MGRTLVQGQPGQKVCKIPSQSIVGLHGTYSSSQLLWVAEIWRIWFQVTPRQKFVRLNFNDKNVGMVTCACHPNCGGKLEIVESWFRQPGQKAKPYLKNK
jgi:hypothetical protein